MPRLLVALGAISFSASLVAQTTWTSFEDRRGHAIAASANGGGVLMFGGESVEQPGNLLGDTNSYVVSTKTWSEQLPSYKPSQRTEHAMAAGLNAVQLPVFVLFGGVTSDGTAQSETFTYEGGGWAKVDIPLGMQVPSPRTGHAMVTDIARNKVILFGGRSGGLPQNDLWEFDPVLGTWDRVIPHLQAGSPIQRYDHCMAYNSITGTVFMFGGSGNRDDTWVYNPNTVTWTEVSQSTRPPGLREAAMSYLDGEDRIVLFGGRNSSTVFGETWVLNPNTYAWTQVAPATNPPARFGHALSVDSSGDEIIMLGGTDNAGSVLVSTWIWNGSDWSEQNAPPSQRTRSAMAYDSGRGLHVAFGGLSQSSGLDLGDTWELDGLNWVPRSPSPSPAPRAEAGMAYDAARGVTVLYGGINGGTCGTPRGDTWEWNGSNWTEIVTSTSPPAAGGVQPVFDTTRNRIWMLVGSDMWSYDGSAWSLHELPVARSDCAYTYDTIRERLVVFGGTTASGDLNDTWEWDGSGWARRSLTISPPPRQLSSMAYHESAGHCVLHGGFDSSGMVNLGDTWTFNGNAWTLVGVFTPRAGHTLRYNSYLGRSMALAGSITNGVLTNTVQGWTGTQWNTGNPLFAARSQLAVAYYPQTTDDQLVVFGGRSGGGQVHDNTWTLTRSTWTNHNPAHKPSARESALSYDPHTNSVLMFGGVSGVVLGDTWSWNGTDWTQISPSTSPPARYRHAAFTTVTRTLIWGGRSTSGARLSDMWEWDGSAWTLIDSGSPSARHNYGAAYDNRRDRVVIFGGSSSCGGPNLNETWEWDGDSWLQRHPPISPAPRVRAQLAYDESRSRVVLFGGTNGTTIYNDTWEWDGDAGEWISQNVVIAAPPTDGHAMSYDQGRKLTVAFGSFGTWDYGAVNPGSIASTPTSTQCLGSNGAVTITPTAWTGPWLGEPIGVTIHDAPTVAIGAMIFGFSNQSQSGIPLPISLAVLGDADCQLNISANIVDVMSLPLPSPYVSAPMPSDPILIGVPLYAQAGFFDGGRPGTPFITTNSLTLTLGAK